MIDAVALERYFMQISRVDAARRRALVRHHEADDAGAVDEAHALGLRVTAEVILENTAVELVARRGEIAARAELHHLVDLRRAFGEEKTEAKFLELMRRQVLFETEHGVEVVGADFDRRLAHFVSGFRHGVAHPFEHDDVQLREALPQLQGERETREATAHDHHVGLQLGLRASVHGVHAL